ncbi:MAG: hypothetical protein KDI42_02630 [Gammaproteobacteria bacterium]|nr:hypothetical protein [Gammaproteobacteria bacterium]
MPVLAFDKPRWYPPEHLENIAEELRDRAVAPAVPPAPACRSRYRSIFAGDETVISIFFGFTELDRIDLVFDPFSRQELERRLRTPCRDHEFVCGFSADESQPWRLKKTLPLPESRAHQVVVELFDSAITDDYAPFADDPDAAKIEQQARKTAEVRALFLDRINRSQVVLYSGHARRGTGPGFGPVAALTQPWFEAAFLGASLRDFRRTLANSPHQPELIGLFACASRDHYLRDLAAVAPNTGFIVSNGDTQPDQDNANLLGTLDALLRRSCKRAFDRALSIGGGDSAYELRGFFDPIPESDRIAPNTWL